VEGFFRANFLSLGDKKFWKLLFLGGNLTNFAIKKNWKNLPNFWNYKIDRPLKKKKKEKKKNTTTTSLILSYVRIKVGNFLKIFLGGNIFLSPHQSKLYILYGIVYPWLLFMLIVWDSRRQGMCFWLGDPRTEHWILLLCSVYPWQPRK